MRDSATSPKASASARAASTSGRWLSRLVRGGALGLALWAGWKIYYITGGTNLHVVIPGKVYRGAQPSPATLDGFIRRFGIRTVVNLRGCCQPEPWYLNECRVVQEHQISQEDVSFSAVHLPSKYEIRQLVEVLERTQYPIFLHCRQGVDLTGMVSASVLLLHTDTPYATARQQMSLRYGHMPIGRTTQLDRFFDLYETWLAQTNQEHTPAACRHWLTREYEGGWCHGRIEDVQRINGDLKLGRPVGLRVGLRNLSQTTWRMSATTVAGIHVYYKLAHADGRPLLENRAGLVERQVGPGERTEVTLVLPPFTQAGTYRLTIDLLDENHCWFGQTGMEPWEEELVFRE